ncbi:PHP domain-containing protein, partial [Parabacteroides sp. OttesenSCG-928-N08]|nr:PHP domain-containing protein [Parabacteroides sp. OttesenSCG-928-N08]
MKKAATIIFALFASVALQAQLRNQEVYEMTEYDNTNLRREVSIPNIPGFETLKCDFHIHTVFSDGLVWPSVRINEAWQQGLDAIAITDHIEYRPHKEVLSGDLNESFKIAKKTAEEIGFLVIPGTEITRSKPLGHLNALFIENAIPMDVEDPLMAIDEAKKQGAFVMWNHPGWPDDKATLYPVHEQLIKEKKINGIEVFNYLEYYPVAFDWCHQFNLAFMANSDIHNTVNNEYGAKIRPMTLVFARERSVEGIKEALFDNRSVALFDGVLAGQAEHLKALVLASLQVRKATGTLLEVTNKSDIPFQATCDGKLYLFPARQTTRMNMPASDTMTLLNCHTGMETR